MVNTSAPASASISVLTDSIPALCHIPRSRITDFSYLITEQFVAQPPRSFLNININEIEMSIIADAEAMRGFASFIRADTERIRRAFKNDSRSSPDEVVEISEETWSVIIVETKEAPPEDVTLGEHKPCITIGTVTPILMFFRTSQLLHTE